jgi:DNA invertase Pin-like site-specific DNA recombinase
MLIGYARVSTYEQNLDLQKDALEKAGCEKLIVDQISGKSLERPGLERIMEVLREGDVLVVWRLDRLGRSLKHLIELVTKLEERNIGFKSLIESMDTTTNLIRERTLAGLASARSRGRKGGRPFTLDEQKRKTAIKLYNSGDHTVKEICQIMGISKPTLYSYLKKAETKARRR